MWPLPLASGRHHLAPGTCPHCEWGGMGLGFEWRQRGQEPLGGDGEHPCPGLTQLGSGSQRNKNVPSPPSEHSTNDPSHRKPDSPRQCLARTPSPEVCSSTLVRTTRRLEVSGFVSADPGAPRGPGLGRGSRHFPEQRTRMVPGVPTAAVWETNATPPFLSSEDQLSARCMQVWKLIRKSLHPPLS